MKTKQASILLGLFVILFCSCSSFKKVPDLDRQKGNYVFIEEDFYFVNLNNPFSVFISGVPCESIFVTPDQGEIVKTGCNFNFIPKDTGQAILRVNVKTSNNRTVNVSNRFLYVTEYVKPKIGFNHLNVYHVNKSELSQSKYLPHYGFPSPYYCIRRDGLINNVSFNLVMKSNGESDTITHKKRMYFKDEYFELLEQMEKGDTILVDNIVMEFANGRSFTLEPVTIIVE